MTDAETTAALDADGPAGWQAKCESVVLGLCAMLRTAARVPSTSAVVEMLRGVPRGGDDYDDVPEASLFSRCASECAEKGGDLSRGRPWTFSWRCRGRGGRCWRRRSSARSSGGVWGDGLPAAGA